MTGSLIYLTVEPTLTDMEEVVLQKLKEKIIERMDIPPTVLKDKKLMEKYLMNQIDMEFKKHKLKVVKEAKEKLIYYLKRSFLGYGKIDLLMLDPNIEDISCNGVNTVLYVWHRKYESIPTNILYETNKELNSIIRRLAYKAGHQISVAYPILEGTLPEGYRVHLTLDEVSKRGDTFTIRKFRADPYTIIDLIDLGTLSPQIAAYLWLLVENLRSIMISGAAASGKTSLLNATCMFIQPEMKLVSIEEVRELRLHENWIPMVTRPSFQPGVQEITLYELLRSALRQRPDYIIVGEIRGEEAYTLFQSIAVGHGGLCTIHADNVDSAIKRLVTRPMNIPEMMIPLMSIMVQIRRMKVGENVARRIDKIVEVKDVAKDGEVRLEPRFLWNAGMDSFEYVPPPSGGDNLFQRISEINHIPVEKLKEELIRRETILRWMAEKGINSYNEVADVVRAYHVNPDEVYEKLRGDYQDEDSSGS